MVTGTLSPDATGTYTYAGLFGGKNYWTRSGAYYIFVDAGEAQWLIQDSTDPPDPGVTPFWAGPGSGELPTGDYGPVAPATGVATVAVE